MHLDLDAFFASVEIKLNPSLRGKPVLVGRVDPHGRSVPRGVIATCSYEARKFGCRSGQPLFQALKLCPEAIVVGGHYEEYIKASNQVFSIAARYAPKIEQTGIDEAFLDFSGTELIYPDLVEIAKKIKEDVEREVGITASIGIAGTKVCAKVASDFQKPDGLTYVELGREKEFLAPLPLTDLPGVNNKTSQKILTILIDSNIVKENKEIAIGDFASLPRDFVEENLGKVGLSLWQAANGIDNLWFSPRAEVKSVSRSETFAKNSSDPKFILAMLQYLTEKVGEEMRREGYFGRCVHVTIRYSDFRTVSRQRMLPYSTALTKEIYEMGEILLKELWDGCTPLRLVGIAVSKVEAKCQTLQPNLFDRVREKRLELEKRVDYLRSKFGKDSVVPATLSGLKHRKLN
ncbi:MAG: hypothetical protein A2126_00285 [Candidatus Woykebacteria bacterium GWB1_45_5]|uniref:DNA polymerase IV n=2 Tax=Candidatus Woykeibacteriota TaxID=1817899 RepID=A0A1G1W055_9BACT|nr:MAG: hypothetical protein A2113_02835 [Candidatus Woykebacteria bacterium GWA1_44_8]OGY23813.1 MAG: hypothetical protein A2126_00285 [Candidatus Woykebacteria bacterium GWB1_45_5]